MPEYNITFDDDFYRRIPKNNPNYWKEINGLKVLSSAAFKPSSRDKDNGLSVNIARLTTPFNSVEDTLRFDIAEFPASCPLNEGCDCRHDPLPDNNSHAIITGITTSIAKKMSNAVTNVFQF